MAETTTHNDAANEPEPRTWTVMVYMAAGDSLQLDNVAIRDLKEMERGANENAHVVVQINRHWPRSAQRYVVKASGSELVKQLAGETDMGQANTLSDFLTWAVQAEEYKANNYFLVLWGHAYGLGFGRDHDDPLKLKELRNALKDFTTERLKRPETQWGQSKGQLELLGANACAMSYVEAAYEMKDCAQYMVASQITVPFAGWPYESILNRITPATSTTVLGQLVVDTYVSQFNDLPGADRLAMTLLNLKRAGGLQELVETLAVAIDTEINDKGFDSDKLASFRDVFIGAAAGDVRPLIDLADLCDDSVDNPTDSIPGTVSKAATGLRNLLPPPSRGVSSVAQAKSREVSTAFLVAYHRRHPDLEDLNGVGIFAPFVTDEETLKRLELQDTGSDNRGKAAVAKQKAGRLEYENLDLFRLDVSSNTGVGRWPGLVYDVLRHRIPSDLMVSIDGIGAMQHGDRADVAQIVLAIDSSLNKLDRVLARARRVVIDTLRQEGEKPKQQGAEGQSFEAMALPGNGNGKGFGPPFLKLVRPLDLETQVATLTHALDLHKLTRTHRAARAGKRDYVAAGALGSADFAGLEAGGPAAGMDPALSPTSIGEENPQIVTVVVDSCARVEKAVGEVERATKRGLTNARFGLGPLSPTQFSLGAEPPKSGEGAEPPKSGEGAEPPKSGEGGNGNSLVSSGPDGDLRGDLALARVADLFRQVGQSLRQLEQATTDLESTARRVLIDLPQVEGLRSKDFFEAAAQEIERAFHLLEEASTSTRRMVRRALAHPVYGLGPGEGNLTLDVRQELASRGGMDKRNLRLL